MKQVRQILKEVALVLVLLLVGGVVMLGIGAGGTPPEELRNYFIDQGLVETGAVNLVSSIYLGYRAFDTFGETIVLLLAVSGVIFIIDRKELTRTKAERPTIGNYDRYGRHRTEILDLISRKLAPYVMLFGLYLISHGHLSPGGGFQGGVVLASGIILLTLGKGVDKIEAMFPIKRVALAEAGTFLLLLGIGVVGIFYGGTLFENFLPGGGPGDPSEANRIPLVSHVFFLNLIIGLKVGAGISLISLSLFKEE